MSSNKITPTKILLKYPTRGRPLQFLQTLAGWLARASCLDRVRVLVTVDDDDVATNDRVLAAAAALHPGLTWRRDPNRSKVEACNRGIAEFADPWDVVLLVSDDMFCRRFGWDDVVQEHFLLNFGRTHDGALWFRDGYQDERCTLECVGRTLYERTGYLYHPAYKSYFCDDERTAQGLRDGWLARTGESICTHEHPCWGAGMDQDDVYLKNDECWDADEATYEARKAAGFPP